ncbi:NfeD family protein [Planctomicrobium sp. SH661]|uniref:NfeD family protein n=1 Tax=Planctomicrobium sp. SH661 TaxID=3448124 RepID=UPI003F5AE525
MMETLFFFSALIGGTFLICQLAMTLLGMSSEAGDIEFADDLPDADSPASSETSGDDGHQSSWLFGIISFRTLVAAATFFGMTGMFMSRIGADLPDQLFVAIASGLAAMFGVHSLMKSFHRLNQSGTLRTSNAIGKAGTVNVSIPANQSGYGKVQIEIQGRLEELPALTTRNEPLAAGSRVNVVGLRGNVLEVEASRTLQTI